MNISEQEKNRIRGLHKNYSIIKEQTVEDEYSEVHDLDVEELNKTVKNLESRLSNLEEDYIRKIGFGDHHGHVATI